jgi:hypothetical protein
MTSLTRGRHLAPRTQRSLPRSTRGQSGLVVVLVTALVGLSLVTPAFNTPAHAAALALCNNPGSTPGIQHVIVVMLENESQTQVVGNATDAPYINSTITKQCGYATNMYGATHWSAANYLALSAGQYPAESPAGCGYITACDSAADNLFRQTETNGLSWKAYEEAMPSACATSSSGTYSIGHNPPLFYNNLATTCAKYDVPVPDLTAAQGTFWNDLQNRTLPSFSFVTPNNINNGHDDGAGVPAIDDFLSDFVPLVQSSNSYQDGTTAMFITFDEGSGGSKGQDCTDRALDMAGNQDSCHIPFFVISPFTPAGPVTSFFDHYSVTRTTEELLGLPLLAGAQAAPSMVDAFGLAPEVTATPSPTATPTPDPTTPSPTASPTSPPQVNLVTNGGFESGTENGWTGVYSANSVTNPTQAEAVSGSWSLAISSTVTDAASIAGVTSKPPVIANATAGTPLTASVWVKSSVAGVYVRQLIWETAPDGTSVGYLGKSYLLQDTNWHRVANGTSYAVKNTGDSVWFSLYTKSLPAGATLYADNFALRTPAT